jgi:NDP-sugar pyrophosphorylase family protein
MDVVVLVGGMGTRLRPLTYDTPKQMLPIVDRPLITHVVSWLARNGLDRAILSLGYRPDAFIEAFPSGSIDGVRLVYAVEPEPLGTAGAVRFAAEQGAVEGRCVVLNGDVLTDLDLTSLVKFHIEREAEASIHLTPVEDPSAFGVVPTDTDGRVTAFLEKPPPGTAPTNLINGGTYVLEPSVLERIPTGRAVSIERETFPALIAGEGLYAMASDDYWLDTGTPVQYLQAQFDILRGLRTAASRPLADEVASGSFVAPGARVQGRRAGFGYFGPGAVVAESAVVTDSIVGAGCQIGRDTEVTRSALLPGVVLGDGCVITDSIVGQGAVVGAGARLEDMTVCRGGLQVPAESVLSGERYPQ